MKRRQKTKNARKGFTIIELLIAIGIIVVLAAIILLFVNRSRAKAADARTQQTLSNIRTAAAEEKVATNNYAVAFASGGKADTLVSTLASQQQLTSGDYAVYASSDEFVVAFPLQAQSGYWCVDAQGNAKRIANPPRNSTPYSCGNTVPTTNTPPVITLNDNANCDPTVVSPGGIGGALCILPLDAMSSYPGYNSSSVYNLSITDGGSSYFPFESPGVTAMDAEDGDISYKLQRSYGFYPSASNAAGYSTIWSTMTGGPLYTPCPGKVARVTYSVTDADGNTVTTNFPNARAVVFCQGAP